MRVVLPVIALSVLGCATDQLEVNPDLKPGDSVGVRVKSCFDDKALENRWGLGIPSLWNALNGCDPPEADEVP